MQYNQSAADAPSVITALPTSSHDRVVVPCLGESRTNDLLQLSRLFRSLYHYTGVSKCCEIYKQIKRLLKIRYE